jgi:nicotinamidase/pyrazinamidase
MASRNLIFWEVDTQADFMLPGGKLYVPGAEKIIPNLKRLVDAARQGRVFVVSSADAHTPDDPEFRQWPPHCVSGTPGAQILPEALADRVCLIPNQASALLPADLAEFQQAVLEKQTLDVFDNPNTERVLQRLCSWLRPDPLFAMFGVVTECCVLCAARGLLGRGCRVALITDAVQALDPEAGRRTLAELASKGARLLTTDEALALLDQVGSQAA